MAGIFGVPERYVDSITFKMPLRIGKYNEKVPLGVKVLKFLTETIILIQLLSMTGPPISIFLMAPNFAPKNFGRSAEHSQTSPDFGVSHQITCVNTMAAGLKYCDRALTVSPSYAVECCDNPEKGAELEGLFKMAKCTGKRQTVVGVLLVFCMV